MILLPIKYPLVRAGAVHIHKPVYLELGRGEGVRSSAFATEMPGCPFAGVLLPRAFMEGQIRAVLSSSPRLPMNGRPYPKSRWRAVNKETPSALPTA